jgi:3-phosphoshikimate 1-carboxyvinyltransferase
MKRIIDPLTRMGADIRGTTEFTPPLSIRGVDKLRAIRYEAAIASAQVKSAILLAGLFADGTTEVIERIPTRDHTERMLGLESVSQDGKSIIRVRGGMKIGAREFVVPGDFSSAAFLMVAGLLVANSEIMLRNVGVNPTRTKLLGLLREHGADITVLEQRIDGGEPTADIRVRTSALTGNIELEGSSVAELIDEIPILTVAWMFSDSLFSVRGAGELRVKESDRIKSLVANLRSLGIRTEDREDGFAFQGNREVIGGDAESFGDHRIAMAFGVAGLGSRQGVRVKGAECVSISYPEFWNVLQAS